MNYYLFYFILLNVLNISNINSLRFTQRKKFLFKNDKPKKFNQFYDNKYIKNNEKVTIFTKNEHIIDEEYEIPEWVNKKVFKYNKKNTKYNTTKY